MQTPGSLAFNPSQQLGTGLRGVSSQPTPASMRRPDLGHYVGFRGPPASASRRTSLAPSVSSGVCQLRTGSCMTCPGGKCQMRTAAADSPVACMLAGPCACPAGPSMLYLGAN